MVHIVYNDRQMKDFLKIFINLLDIFKMDFILVELENSLIEIEYE